MSDNQDVQAMIGNLRSTKYAIDDFLSKHGTNAVSCKASVGDLIITEKEMIFDSLEKMYQDCRTAKSIACQAIEALRKSGDGGCGGCDNCHQCNADRLSKELMEVSNYPPPQ